MVCGLVAWLWPRPIRLRSAGARVRGAAGGVVPAPAARACAVSPCACACACARAKRREIFTAWGVRRKPVVVTARGGQPATTCGRAGLACCSASARRVGAVEPRKQCNATAASRGSGPRNGGTPHTAGREDRATVWCRGRRQCYSGTVVRRGCPRVNAAVGSSWTPSGLGTRERAVPVATSASTGSAHRPVCRRFIWLPFSRPIGETTEGITCSTPPPVAGRGKGLFPCRGQTPAVRALP